jgi:hypothetical protein
MLILLQEPPLKGVLKLSTPVENFVDKVYLFGKKCSTTIYPFTYRRALDSANRGRSFPAWKADFS